MARFIMKKGSPRLDMNPMVDMAFLLVTFFMLATTFKTEEPVMVDVPSSQTELKLPEKDIMVITVNREGKVFFSIDGKFSRKTMLSHMANKYGLTFSDQESYDFSLITSFGMPVESLNQYLSQSVSERKKIIQPGIPIEQPDNQLADWIVFARVSNPRLRVAIKGDGNTPYPLIKKVMDTLIDNNVLRFNLITQLERDV